MKAVQILALVLPLADAFVSHSSFVGRPALVTRPSGLKAAWTMDMEMDSLDPVSRRNLEKTLGLSIDLDAAEAKHGMPWKDSIDPKVEDDELLYLSLIHI